MYNRTYTVTSTNTKTTTKNPNGKNAMPIYYYVLSNYVSTYYFSIMN